MPDINPDDPIYRRQLQLGRIKLLKTAVRSQTVLDPLELMEQIVIETKEPFLTTVYNPLMELVDRLNGLQEPLTPAMAAILACLYGLQDLANELCPGS